MTSLECVDHICQAELPVDLYDTTGRLTATGRRVEQWLSSEGIRFSLDPSNPRTVVATLRLPDCCNTECFLRAFKHDLERETF